MMNYQESRQAQEPPLVGAAFVRNEDAGRLTLSGRDRLTFLQRLSTNDLHDLTAGQGRPTVLCSGTGRVMALLIVYVDADKVYARTEPGQGAAVARYLNKLIFWNDELQVADTGARVAQWDLFGPAAGELLAGLTGAPQIAGLAPYAWAAAAIDGQAVSIERGGALEAADWHIVGATEAAGNIEAALAGHAHRLDAAAQEQRRVEAGIPAWGRELSEQVTPLEAGLAAAVSFNKGCYTGQEVIARQHNYDKVPRLLAGLLLPDDAGPDLAGAAVRPVGAAGGRPGFIGSVVYSPALGRMIALAVVPRDAAAPGSEVVVAREGSELRARVSALPFDAAGRSERRGRE